jgi:hypothetical protein
LAYHPVKIQKRPISRENIMVLDGAMEQEELTLLPVDGFSATYEQDVNLTPAFIFGDDDDIEEEDDFEEEDDYEDEDEDFNDEEELEEEDDDDEEDDYEEDDEDDDFDEEDEEEWDDDYE